LIASNILNALPLFKTYQNEQESYTNDFGRMEIPDPKVSAIDNANVPFINSLYKNTLVLNLEPTD
jgi:hypothetical protein